MCKRTIKYDFNKRLIQVVKYEPETKNLIILTEIDFSKLGDMINVRLIVTPFALVKHDVHGNAIDFLWPREFHIQLKENELVDFQSEGKLYASRWFEDPEYREEIIIRDLVTGKILEISPGYLRMMPDGSTWIMTR